MRKKKKEKQMMYIYGCAQSFDLFFPFNLSKKDCFLLSIDTKKRDTHTAFCGACMGDTSILK